MNGRIALSEKRKEIEAHVQSIAAVLAPGWSDAISASIPLFVQITTPTVEFEVDDDSQSLTGDRFNACYHAILINRSGGGISRKPGNIIINWPRLMETVPDVALATVGAVSLPHWTIPLVGLYLWNKLSAQATLHLEERHATTLIALWAAKDGRLQIATDKGYEAVVAQCMSNGSPPLTRSDYERVLDDLSRMRCIEIENGIIVLRELLKTQYN